MGDPNAHDQIPITSIEPHFPTSAHRKFSLCSSPKTFFFLQNHSYQYIFSTWRVLKRSRILSAASLLRASTMTPVVSLSSR